MGKRAYWYGHAKKMCKRYHENTNSLQELIFKSAIDSTIDEITKQENGKVKLQVINMVLLDQTDNITSAARKVNYSQDTVYPWISEFIKRVGEKAGF